MVFEHKVYSALCHMETFIINGIRADELDFGMQYDNDEENAEEYGCGNMIFIRKESTPEVLKKYGINQNEYSEICETLESELSFGSCGWCV